MSEDGELEDRRSEAKELDDRQVEAKEGTRLMLSGAGLGLVGAASAVVLGASCPLCVVGAPALIGWGAYKRWSATREPADEPITPG